MSARLGMLGGRNNRLHCSKQAMVAMPFVTVTHGTMDITATQRSRGRKSTSRIENGSLTFSWSSIWAGQKPSRLLLSSTDHQSPVDKPEPKVPWTIIVQYDDYVIKDCRLTTPLCVGRQKHDTCHCLQQLY